MRRWLSLIVALVALVFVALPAFAGQEELSQVRNSVAKYHHLDKALADGFVPFSINAGEEVTCFDSATGGMGIHYVRNIDDVLDPSDPEALVYEVLPNGKSKLVAVEYIIPSDFVDESNPPSLFGRELHPHAFLKVWILHAWVFSPNPDGMFADFNPRVGQCPFVDSAECAWSPQSLDSKHTQRVENPPSWSSTKSGDRLHIHRFAGDYLSQQLMR